MNHRPLRASIPVLLALAGCSAAPPPTAVVATPVAAPLPAEEVIYCPWTVERRGVEECPEPISQEVASHRGHSDVLHLVNGRLMSIETINGPGELDEDGDRVAILEYRWEGDRLKEVAAFSSARIHKYTKVFSEDRTRVDYVAPSGRPRLHYRLATAEVRQFDERGLIRSRRFFDRLGKPTKNRVGVYELRYTRDERGYWTEIEELDDQGKPMLNEEGFHRLTFERGPIGTVLGERYFGLRGEKVLSAGAHSFQATHDPWGNRTMAQFFDGDGNPAFHSKHSARWEARFDEHGNQTELTYHGLDGKPVTMKDDWATRRSRYDGRGREVEARFFGADGQPIRWAPIRKYRWDTRSRVVERQYFDAAERPWPDGVASERVSYDDADNKVLVRFFDAQKRPVLGTAKWAEYTVTYNEDDQPIEKKYFGTDGQPADSTKESARAVYTYDAAGKLVRTDYFDPQGNPTVRMGARHLLVMYAGSNRAVATVVRTKDEARLRAEEAKKKIAEGMSFEEAVRLYSDEPGAAARGGDLGIFPRGRMVLDFENGVLATPVGEVSAVIETPFGFHVLERTQ